MTTTTRNKISFLTACIGTAASVYLVGVYVPEGPGRWAIIGGEFFLAVSRLYLFYEGTALNEVSREKAKIAFRLSVILSVALAVYGYVIYRVNPNFQNYALALFLMLQMGIAFVEWVFASRTGEQVNTVLVSLQNRSKGRLNLALYFRSVTKEQAKQIESKTKTIQANTKRINLLSKENANQNQKIAELTKKQAKLNKYKANIDRINGAPVCLCPGCLQNGEVNILRGGSRAKVLVCSECEFKIVVPEKEKL